MIPAIQIDTKVVIRIFGVAVAILCVGHLLSQLAKYRFGVPFAYGLVDLFDMNLEGSIPTYFSGVQLLVCSFVLAVIGLARRVARDGFALHWLMLAVMFFLLAADELVSIHELTIRIGSEFAPELATGILYWSWIVPGALLVLGVSIFYARFVISYLPPYTRNRTVLGAALFVGGAIGVEMFEARHVEQSGMENLTMGLYVFVEESLEKIGILVFLSGILRYLSVAVGSVVFKVVSVDNATARAP